MDKAGTKTTNQFTIISPVFREKCPIPPQYTCKGQGVNPPLCVFYPPAKTKSLTLIMHDPDAISGDFLHWLVWNIPPNAEPIGVNSLPPGALEGLNDGGQPGYYPPCPPAGSGTHHYIFDFYALDTTLNLPADSKIKDVIKAQKGHVLGRSTLTGLFGKED